jgi:tRNA(Ile)-lysidine synthase TilS/MesJ
VPISCQNGIAPPARARRVASIARVIFFWVALAILVVALVAGVVFALLRALETKRAAKSLKDALGVELQRIARAGERTNEELEAARKAFERLEASLKQLATARARVRLIKEVIAEAEAVATRARAFIPSK